MVELVEVSFVEPGIAMTLADGGYRVTIVSRSVDVSDAERWTALRSVAQRLEREVGVGEVLVSLASAPDFDTI